MIAHPSGDVTIALPGGLVTREDVVRQLTSGLTTTFRAAVDLSDERGRHFRSSIDVDIRYHLWDDRWLIRIATSDQGTKSLIFSTYDALAAWWSEPLITGRIPAGFVPRDARVRVEMLPFSAKEGEDVRRWLADSIRAESGQDAAGRTDQPSGVLDVIIGTSVRRRPLQSWEWSVKVETRP